MRLGDVMVRDVRALHRGTPNRTQSRARWWSSATAAAGCSVPK
jgi:hypothetical protein